MLEDLLKGAEKSRLVLVTDATKCPGRHLLLNWLHNLGTRCDKLILICFERAPCFYKNWLEPDLQKKIIIIGNNATSNLERDTNDLLASATNMVMSQMGEAVGIVIDSLSLHIVQRGTPLTCRQLHQLATGSRVTQVVALLHRDVHDRSTCSLLEHVASSVVEVTSAAGSKQMCCVRHCRPTGKVFRSREYYITDDSFHIKGFGTTPSVDSSSQNVSQNDLSATLPFNLTLTDTEKDARSKVKLPYLKDGTEDSELSEGRIFYQPDKVDDFDEEDPDDDLNI